MRDRRRHGPLAWLLAPLPWSWQVVGDYIPAHVGQWLLVALIVLIGGPWLGLAFYVGRQIPPALRDFWNRLEFRARPLEFPKERAIWLVRFTARWRYTLLRKTGLLWLPKRVPLLGADLFLFDLTGSALEAPRVLMAARLANPRTRRGRRMRRLVRVEALWWLEAELPLLELPLGPEAYLACPIVALDPPDEQWATWRERLLAKHGFFEPRRPTWRHERKAWYLFHKLWGMHGAGEKYDKPVWGELQQELNQAGMRL
ncbi:MAG: hypothetical protein ABIQ41_05445 [Gemmatimonadales bacterium]